MWGHCSHGYTLVIGTFSAVSFSRGSSHNDGLIFERIAIRVSLSRSHGCLVRGSEQHAAKIGDRRLIQHSGAREVAAAHTRCDQAAAESAYCERSCNLQRYQNFPQSTLGFSLRCYENMQRTMGCETIAP